MVMWIVSTASPAVLQALCAFNTTPIWPVSKCFVPLDDIFRLEDRDVLGSHALCSASQKFMWRNVWADETTDSKPSFWIRRILHGSWVKLKDPLTSWMDCMDTRYKLCAMVCVALTKTSVLPSYKMLFSVIKSNIDASTMYFRNSDFFVVSHFHSQCDWALLKYSTAPTPL